jgi:hypothetical protein
MGRTCRVTAIVHSEISLGHLASVSGFLLCGPWLEREEPKGKEVQAWNKSEQAPHWIMTGATKDLHDRDNKKKERRTTQARCECGKATGGLRFHFANLRVRPGHRQSAAKESLPCVAD